MRTKEEVKVIEKLIDLIADEADYEEDAESGIYFPEADLQWNCYLHGDITWGNEVVFLTYEEQEDIIKMINARNAR